MAESEFDDVRCTAQDGQETEFYHWAIKLQKDPWTVRTDKIQDIKYLFFRWNHGQVNAFEVSMKFDLETGHYDVCNVVPLAIPQFTPREYNNNLERFVNEILIPFNQENGNSLHFEYERCGGRMTYDYSLDIKDMWSKQTTEDLQKIFVREMYCARIEIMEDVLNRYTHEIVSLEKHSEISHQIADIITRQLLRPADCDVLMAAQCFVGMCMKKMVMCTPPTTMFDEFLTDEYRKHLNLLIGVDTNLLEGTIQIGAIRTSVYSFFAN